MGAAAAAAMTRCAIVRPTFMSAFLCSAPPTWCISLCIRTRQHGCYTASCNTIKFFEARKTGEITKGYTCTSRGNCTEHVQQKHTEEQNPFMSNEKKKAHLCFDVSTHTQSERLRKCALCAMCVFLLHQNVHAHNAPKCMLANATVALQEAGTAKKRH